MPTSKGYTKKFADFEDGWYCWDTGKTELCQELIPTDWPLEFHRKFVEEVQNNPSLTCMGDYTNGWEL